MPLGAGQCLLQLVSAERNIHTSTDILKFGKIVDRRRYGFQFVGCVLPLPTLRILPALFSLNAQILHQQICKAGEFGRLLRGGFPHFEQVGNPFFELSNLRPDFPNKAVYLLSHCPILGYSTQNFTIEYDPPNSPTPNGKQKTPKPPEQLFLCLGGFASIID